MATIKTSTRNNSVTLSIVETFQIYHRLLTSTPRQLSLPDASSCTAPNTSAAAPTQALPSTAPRPNRRSFAARPRLATNSAHVVPRSRTASRTSNCRTASLISCAASPIIHTSHICRQRRDQPVVVSVVPLSQHPLCGEVEARGQCMYTCVHSPPYTALHFPLNISSICRAMGEQKRLHETWRRRWGICETATVAMLRSRDRVRAAYMAVCVCGSEPIHMAVVVRHMCSCCCGVRLGTPWFRRRRQSLSRLRCPELGRMCVIYVVLR